MQELIKAASDFREGAFCAKITFSHLDQILGVIELMEERSLLLHPDSDEAETLSFWVGDVLEPLLRQLEKGGVEDFSPAELLKMKQQQEYAKDYFKELTTP